MTYTMAKMIIWNDEAYPPKRVREAAIFITACMDALSEDITQAAFFL